MGKIKKMLDEDCAGCRVKSDIAKGHSRYLADEYCKKVCPVGKKIKKLSLKVEMGLEPIVGHDLTADEYAICKEQGMTDKAICEKYKIAAKTLQTRKKHWGFGDPRRFPLKDRTKQEYLELKLKGMYDREIAKLWGCVGKTLWRWKKNHGLKGGLESELKLDKQGRTKEEYLQLRVSGMRDYEIKELWGVKADTLTKWKRSYGLKG